MHSVDEKLVSQTLAGDRDAFGVLVHKYQDMVYTYAYQKVRNETDSQDITQEIFLQAFRHLHKLRHPHLFRSWLYTIMSNECKRWLARATKKRRREIVLEEAADEALRIEPEHTVPTEGWEVELEQAISALPDESRIVVSMFYMGDCSLKEISEFLGVSVNTVKSKLHRARQQLGSTLSERYGGFLKSHKLKGGFLMQLMEQIRHIPSPTMGFAWSSATVSKTLFSLITALCILVGLIGVQDDSQKASSGNQIGLSPSDTSQPIPVAFLTPAPNSTRPLITGIPTPTGKRPLTVSNRAPTQQSRESIDRGRTSRTGGAKDSNPQFSAAASESDSDILAFSGRVVDTDGKPIAGVPIAVAPLWYHDEKISPIFNFESYMINAETLFKSDTDEEGRFSITGIKPGPIQFIPLPNYVEDGYIPAGFDRDNVGDAEVLSIDIGVMTFYPGTPESFHFGGGIPFAIEPGTHLENIEIVVRPRMRIRGQIVFTDGTPLANTRVLVNVRHRSFDGERIYNSGPFESQTDNAGYFVYYLDLDVEGPGFYSVAVEFQGLSATSEQFALEAGQRRDDLVISLDSPPIPIEPTPDWVEPERDGAWVLNPENGHAYRSIHCKHWEDAQSKAINEDAHLVSINDASEQKWLVEVFGIDRCWIGLTDIEKEGEWRWANGEPITYTNWAPNEPTGSNQVEEDYVFMEPNPDGKWHDVGPENPKWRIIRIAVIERGGLVSTPPIEEN